MSEEDIEQIEIILSFKPDSAQEAHVQQYLQMLYDHYKNPPPEISLTTCYNCKAKVQMVALDHFCPECQASQ